MDGSFDFDAVLRVLNKCASLDLPAPFFKREGVIWEDKSTNQDPNLHQFVCKEFQILGRTKNEVGESWGILIEFEDHGGASKEITIPYDMAASNGADAIKLLCNQGLHIDITPSGKASFIKLLSRLSPDQIVTTASKPGFYDGAYLSPIGEVIGKVDETLRLDPSGGADDRVVRGTLEGWKQEVASKCFDYRTPHWALSLFAGSAGMFLTILDEPTCGVNWSGTSSLGKSTGQMIAAGIWAQSFARKRAPSCSERERQCR